MNQQKINLNQFEIDSQVAIDTTIISSQEYFEAEVLAKGKVEFIKADGEIDSLDLAEIIGDNSCDEMDTLNAKIFLASISKDQNSTFLKKMLEGQRDDLIKTYIEDAALYAANIQHGVEA
jgi:hypothetical protein